MGKKLENKELRADVTLPDPITGRHWCEYATTYRDLREKGQDAVAAKYEAALKVIEAGSCRLNGEAHEIKGLGLDAPLEVVVWLGDAVDDLMGEKLSLPKKLSAMPSPQPKAEEAPPQS